MELYMVCVMMAIALAIVIIKSIQCVLSIIHPIPSEADIRWTQNPHLPLEQHKKQIKMANKNIKSLNNGKDKEMSRTKSEPKGKRLPRNIRLERLYAGSPASFDEYIDTSFSRRSDFDSNYNRSPPPRSVDDYIIHNPNQFQQHQHYQQPRQMNTNQPFFEQISFVEDNVVDDDEEDDPIEAYVIQQHRKILESSQNRSSTPIQQSQQQQPKQKYHYHQQHSIQSPVSPTSTSTSYSKSQTTIV